MKDSSSLVKCQSCGKKVASDDACPDDYCRDCHKSLSFEACCDGSYVNDIRARYGLPPAGSY